MASFLAFQNTLVFIMFQPVSSVLNTLRIVRILPCILHQLEKQIELNTYSIYSLLSTQNNICICHIQPMELILTVWAKSDIASQASSDVLSVLPPLPVDFLLPGIKNVTV